MDRFVNDQNLERYRKLACATTTRAEREMLFASLAEEKVQYFEPPKAGQDVSRKIALRVAHPNGQEAVTALILHECGHLLAARSLGFTTGAMHFSLAEAGVLVAV